MCGSGLVLQGLKERRESDELCPSDSMSKIDDAVCDVSASKAASGGFGTSMCLVLGSNFLQVLKLDIFSILT